MKISTIKLMGLALATLLIISCGGKIDRPDPIMTDAEKAARQSQTETPTIPISQLTGGVKHYTCPNGHAGADAQGACVVCGTTLVHNQAFHDQVATDPAAPGGEPPQNAVGVWHYTCPNGHPGGAGSAVACSQCGTTLIHNTTYHDGGAPTTDLSTGIQDVPPPTTSTTPEPPQNAAGVWHYTCPNGHQGGAGSAVACSQCGTTLIHNQVYHQ